MLARYSDRFMSVHSETVFNYVNESIISKIIAYVINSEYRQATSLTPWLAQQIDTISEELYQYAAQIPNSDNHDDQVWEVLRFVRSNFQYVGDLLGRWKMKEYWQTAEESILTNSGDCEDGAILMYALCRIKGVPANRLMLFAGWVKSAPTAKQGGHCWLGFKPLNYPHNYVILDWCYYPTTSLVKNRPKYYINNKQIVKYIDDTLVDSKYKTIWFGFNEEKSFSSL